MNPHICLSLLNHTWRLRIATVLAACVLQIGTLYAQVGPPAKSPPGLSLELKLSADMYNPSAPGKASVKCTLRNDSDHTIQAPVGYDGRTVMLIGKSAEFVWPETLQVARESKSPVKAGGASPELRELFALPDKPELKPLEPGKELVVFEFPLEKIFNRGVWEDKPESKFNRRFYWSWPAESSPPRSPIALREKSGYVERASFWAVIQLDEENRVESKKVELKIDSQSTQGKQSQK